MQKAQGATKESLNNLGAQFAVEWPSEYLDFMLSSDGGAGPVGENSYLQIWPVGDLSELNDDLDYVTDDYPDWLFFGSNGGGMWFAFDKSQHPMSVVAVDMIDPDNHEVMGASFEDFLEKLYTAEE
jgi:hypothetical protein